MIILKLLVLLAIIITSPLAGYLFLLDTVKKKNKWFTKLLEWSVSDGK